MKRFKEDERRDETVHSGKIEKSKKEATFIMEPGSQALQLIILNN